MDLNRSRFRKRIIGKVKRNLEGHLSNKDLITRGKFGVYDEKIPQFEYDWSSVGGVGQGDTGDVFKKSGDEPGERKIETEISIDEVADILKEKLDLPFKKSKEGDLLSSQKTRYNKIAKHGSIRRYKRSFRNALPRIMASGNYDPDNPIVVPEGREWDYINQRIMPDMSRKAVIIYMMDVSDSMREEQKFLARTNFTWHEKMVARMYKEKKVPVHFIIHSSTAEETNRHDFYHTSNSGGTMVSSAYQLCNKIIEDNYPPSEWDIYPVHITDGDNVDFDDEKGLFWVRELLSKSAAFCYGQCPSRYVTRDKLFLDHIVDYFDLREGLFVYPTLRLAKIENSSDHFGVLKTFLSEKSDSMYKVFPNQNVSLF